MAVSVEFEAWVTELVGDAIEAGLVHRIEVRWSQVRGDQVIKVELTGPTPHRLVLRVQQGGALLDVDGSAAMEFAEDDERDLRDLEHVLRAYCRGELEVLVDLGDGGYRALRASGGQLGFPGSAVRLGRAEWRRVG